jgi:threonine/homoserine/homoserine lactone efflux protein
MDFAVTNERGGVIMRLSAPKVIVFWIAVALAAIGALSFLGIVPIEASTGFWALLIGFVLLALGNLLKDL